MTFKNKVINWLWKYANNPDYSQEDEDFGELLEDYKKRLHKIKEVYHPKDNDELKQIALSFDNAYSQRKMIEANNSLKLATWVLALATIGFTIKEIWGAEKASGLIYNIFAVIVPGFMIIILIGAGLFIVNKIIKMIIKFLMRGTKYKPLRISVKNEN